MTDPLHDQPQGQPPADVVDEAIRAIELETIPAGPPADLVAATLGALGQPARTGAGSIPMVPWTSVFKLVATAASLAMAIALAAFLVPIIESPSTALADVFSEALAQVRRLQSMSYRQQMSVEGQPQPIVTQEYVAEDGRRRSEMTGYTTVYDKQGNLRLTLVEPTHTALVREAAEGPGPDAGKSFLDWLQHHKPLEDKPEKDLGKKEIDGKPASGFVAKQDDRTFTMWIDDATGGPVQIEFDSQFGGAPAHVTLTDFRFHQPLDEVLFSFDVPPGYEVLGGLAGGQVESPAGLQRVWSRAGSFAGVAAAGDRSLLYGLQLPGVLSEVNELGEPLATFSLDEDSRLLRATRLREGEKGQLLTFRRGGTTVEARGLEGQAAEAKLLWDYPEEERLAQGWTVNDVAAADLDGDGLDEVIVGSGGDFRLQVLDHQGNLLWKNTDQTKIWRVAAGDVEGDSRPEVLATGSSGKVHVLDGQGKRLREIDPGFFAFAVGFWRQQDPADRRLEALVADRDALLRRIRNQKLQILLVRNSKTAGAGSQPGAIERTIAADIAQDPEIVELTTRRDELKAAIKEQRSGSERFGRNLAQTKQQLAQLQEELARREAGLDSGSLSSRTGKTLNVFATAGSKGEMLRLLQSERNVLQKNAGEDEKRIAGAFDEYKKLDTETADLENRETQLEDLKAIIKRVSYQLNLWNLELDAGQRIKIADPAQKPQGSDARLRALAAAAAGLVGFITATFLAALLLRRRWLLASGLGLVLGSSLAALVLMCLPVRYEASALIKVGRTQPVVIENVVNGGLDDASTYDVFRKTQMQWIKSPFVLGRAARKPEMLKLTTIKEHKDDPVGYLEGKITVDYPGDAELMRVSIKGTHRDDLATIVNAVVESYMEEIVTGDKMARLKQRDLLHEHYSKSKVEYRELASSYHELAKQMGANSSETAMMRKKLLTMRLESLIASRNALEDRIRDCDLKIEMLKQNGDKPGEPAAPPAAGQAETRQNRGGAAAAADPAINSDAEKLVGGELAGDRGTVELTRRMAELKLMIKEQQFSASPSAPAQHFAVLRPLLRQVASLEEQIEQRKSELQAASVAAAAGKADEKQPAADAAEVAAMLPLLETELKELEKNLAAANEQIEIQMRGGDRSKSLILVAGTGERDVPLAALDVEGKTLWSLKLSAAVANLAVRADKPWLAVALRDGNVRVVDMAAGKELAHVGRQGETADVAWLPLAEGKSLLVIASDSGLEGYRVTAD